MGTRARERGTALAAAIKAEEPWRLDAALSGWKATVLSAVLAALVAYVSSQGNIGLF